MRLIFEIFRSFFNSPLVVLLLLLLLFLSLQLISSATIDSKLFGQIYYFLLAINLVTLFLFLLVIFNQGLKLYRQYKQRVAGSHLTLRMVLTFTTLVILPMTILYFFSIQFIQRSIDSWFDASVEQALEDAMTLSRSTIDESKRDRLKQIRLLVDEIQRDTSTLSILTLSELREQSGSEEVSLLSSKGKLIASTSEEEGDIVPNIPGIELLLPLQRGRDHVQVDLSEDGNSGIRVLVRLQPENKNDYLVLQAIYPISSRQRKLVSSVQQAYTEYSELVYLRKPLKDSFSLTLSLVLLLGLLSAIWAAFVFAKRLSSPIRDLAEGTRAVAEGNYHKPIPLLDSGDLGQLVQSFNKMTRQLSKTHHQLQISHEQSEVQRAYLQVVLSSLTSGVLSLNAQKKIQTVNPETNHILRAEINKYIGLHIQNISHSEPFLHPLIDEIIHFIDSGSERWHEEIQIQKKTHKCVVVCRGTILPDKGYVIVIEDVTTLIRAQRDAAWGEVARRLAHEIKNPLTPIQLSAERISHKFDKQMEGKDKETLRRLTSTIVSQVDNMKEMVKAFSEYARLPELKKSRIRIDSLISEVISMYKSAKNLKIDMEVNCEAPLIEADPGKIRQILHNLIKNSLEAMEEQPEKHIQISVNKDAETISPDLVLSLVDNGPGINETLLSNIFDPYVTGKSKGSGLGLAIVKKIVEEHGGQVHAENQSTSGARITILLPLMKMAH